MVLQRMAHWWFEWFCFPRIPPEKVTTTMGYPHNSKPPVHHWLNYRQMAGMAWESTEKLRRFCFLFCQLFAFSSCALFWNHPALDRSLDRNWLDVGIRDHFTLLSGPRAQGSVLSTALHAFEGLGKSEIQGCLPQIDLWMQSFATVAVSFHFVIHVSPLSCCAKLQCFYFLFLSLRLDALPVLMYTCHGWTQLSSCPQKIGWQFAEA